MRHLAQNLSAGVKGDAASTETRLHPPPSSLGFDPKPSVGLGAVCTPDT